MGRSTKNKRRRGSHSNSPKYNRKAQKNKKQRVERFWIEDCKESTAPEGAECLVEVLITRTELTDDYIQAPKPQINCNIDKTSSNEIEVTEKVTKVQAKTHKYSLDIGLDPPGQPKAVEDVEKKSLPERADASKNGSAASKSEAEGISDTIGKEIVPSVSVRRSKKAKRPIKRIFDSVENFEPLPNGDCGDGILNPHPKDEVPDKFWSQRRRLFSRFDEGIQLDKESWYSVTPEAIANHIAAHLVGQRRNITVLDPFCGCGGNAIAFALRNEVDLVVCVDTDMGKLQKAALNAKIYGVTKEKILFIHGNACEVLSRYKNGRNLGGTKASEGNGPTPDDVEYTTGGLDLLPEVIDAVFLSPPWGGMDYGKVGKRNYNLKCIKVDGGMESKSIDGEDLLERAAQALGCKPIAFFLPRNINGIAAAKSAFRAGYKDCPLILEQNMLNGKLKTVTAYFGL